MGGPTRAGGMYEVLKGGRSELLHERGRTFLMAAQDGHVTPLSAMPGASPNAGPGLDLDRLAAAVAAATPSTMLLNVEGCQMTAHVEGVIDRRDRSLVAAIGQGVRG